VQTPSVRCSPRSSGLLGSWVPRQKSSIVTPERGGIDPTSVPSVQNLIRADRSQPPFAARPSARSRLGKTHEQAVPALACPPGAEVVIARPDNTDPTAINPRPAG